MLKFVILFIVINYSARSEYLGCFKDNVQRMFNYMKDYPNTLTPTVCIDHCKKNAYAYAGLQYRSQCFCGDIELDLALKTDEKECNFECSGDDLLKCGGFWRNSVYKAGNTVIANIASISYDYLGCFKDQEEPRSLQGMLKDFGDYLTPLECVELCKGYGYLYAGLQYRSQCFCGDQTPKERSKVPDSECSAKCSGEVTSICGGTWRNTIYATGLTEVSTVASFGYNYEGCYKDQERRRLNSYMKDFGENMIPEECVSLCKRYGYRFAGLQYRSQCFCGDLDLAIKDKRPESECSYKCSGDLSKICGGHYRNTVYATGIIGKGKRGDTAYPYLGCYKDYDYKRRLKGDFRDFGDENTPEKCVNYCSKKGYKYAGLQYSSQCFCGDQEPLQRDKVDDKECTSRCSGDKSLYCGAGWRNTIYYLQTENATVEKIGDQYLGCYNDFIEPRQLNGKFTNLGINATPQNCINFCFENDFLYAGLQESSQCYCGNDEPLLSDATNETECNSRCLGDKTKLCGGKFKNTIYKTNKPVSEITNESASCKMSITRANGKPTCEGDVIFYEDFSNQTLSKRWSHIVQIAGEPDSEFVILKKDSLHSFIKDGNLIIKPTVLPDDVIKRGKIQLDGCTGKANTTECSQDARIYLVLPAVESARIHTRDTFSFRFGRIDIRAKLPKGDWLVPDLWLVSKDQVYGPYYSSGRIRVAMARGNENLLSKDGDLSCRALEIGVAMGVDENVRERTSIITNSECWSSEFHEYSVIWSHNNISFLVDGENAVTLIKPGQGRLSEVIGFSNDISALWSVGSDIAPFDSDFYITIGLSAGGVRNFPDNINNAGRLKPWKNSEVKRNLKFWEDRKFWESTWESPTLEVDYVKVTAI